MGGRIKEILGPKYSHTILHRMLLEEIPLPLTILIREAKKMVLQSE